MLEVSWTHQGEDIFDTSAIKKKKIKIFNYAPFLLTGLLNPDNVQEAIQATPIVDSGSDMAQNIKTIAEFCAAVGKFIKDFIWCLANPINALLILLEKMTPLMVAFASIVPIIALISMLFGSKKLLKWNTKDLVVNPLILLFIYLIVIALLRALV